MKFLMVDLLRGEDLCDFSSKISPLTHANLNDYEKHLIEFSHWSHEFTNKHLMVDGLRGRQNENKFILTSPIVHSREKCLGRSDLGMDGFGKFYANHKTCYLSRNIFAIFFVVAEIEMFF
jgi:hypothetical protein